MVKCNVQNIVVQIHLKLIIVKKKKERKKKEALTCDHKLNEQQSFYQKKI
jgi:hypothetical protein